MVHGGAAWWCMVVHGGGGGGGGGKVMATAITAVAIAVAVPFPASSAKKSGVNPVACFVSFRIHVAREALTRPWWDFCPAPSGDSLRSAEPAEHTQSLSIYAHTL